MENYEHDERDVEFYKFKLHSFGINSLVVDILSAIFSFAGILLFCNESVNPHQFTSGVAVVGVISFICCINISLIVFRFNKLTLINDNRIWSACLMVLDGVSMVTCTIGYIALGYLIIT